MSNENSFATILARMLSHVPNDVDKREGSIIYDAVAPMALELARFYSELRRVTDESFADTAGREMLVRRAAERGISPIPATSAIVMGEFQFVSPDERIPIGARFRLAGDGENRLIYRVIEDAGVAGMTRLMRMVCESIGGVGNRASGDLLPIGDGVRFEGLSFARIREILSPGRDEEELERFRRRYFDNLEVQSYGGNISDYRKMVLSLHGVGGVKVEPAWQGGGTVRLIIQDDQFLPPSDELSVRVQDTIDPIQNSGSGLGLAPIGHRVTVIPVRGVAINVTANFTLASGWRFDDVRFDLQNIVSDYLAELSSNWDRNANLIVRASQIESRLLNEFHGRVVDISDLRLNGAVSGRNVVLAPHEIPLRGTVNDG
ncbi:MAG: baseplate J/gp47 family protein [Oscillospiraceae bacterium]|nr:baseplate J/gp47 family protein [Oscillospiraceae bacterium]